MGFIQPVVSNHLNHLKKLIMERVVIFACLLALGSCMKIHFKNCGSTAPSPAEVVQPSASNSPPRRITPRFTPRFTENSDPSTPHSPSITLPTANPILKLESPAH